MRIRTSWTHIILTIAVLTAAGRGVRGQSFGPTPNPGYPSPGYGPGYAPGPGVGYPEQGGQPGPGYPGGGYAMPPSGYGAPALPPGAGPGGLAMGPGPGMMMGPAPGMMGPAPGMMGPAPGMMGGPAPGMAPGMMPSGGLMGMPPGAYAVHPAAYQQGPPAEFSGAPVPMPQAPPPAYGPPGYPMGSPMMGGYYPAEQNDDFDFNILRRLLPHGAGGVYAPRWFDVHAEAVYMTRETVGRNSVFSTNSVVAPGQPVNPAQVLLSTDNLNLDDEAGFRTTFALQLGAGNNLEFGYLGLVHWAGHAEALPNPQLFSAFSNFGQLGTPGAGFPQTDLASLHTIDFSSQFDTIELNFRKRWQAPNGRLQGSWIAGVRYFQLKEDFLHRTVGANPADFLIYQVGTSNSMTGFQTGGDLWVAVLPGLNFGGDLKAGIYGNRADQLTSVNSSNAALAINGETLGAEQVALLAEANLMVVWRLNENWSIRGGYNFLYADGVALASENVNTTLPGVATRTPLLNVNGSMFAHGATLGLEWLW